jgi:hypothetical protein
MWVLPHPVCHRCNFIRGKAGCISERLKRDIQRADMDVDLIWKYVNDGLPLEELQIVPMALYVLPFWHTLVSFK